MKAPKERDVSEGLRECFSCLKILPITEYHKHKGGILGRRAECRTCRNFSQYQTILGNRLDGGEENIVECAGCECYMKKSRIYATCKRCRVVESEE